jgi:hypothetical protein
MKPPPVTDPIESLAACDLCQILHCEVWKVYRKPRVTKRWKDRDPDDQADGRKGDR